MTKIRQSARGERCTVNIVGVCNHDPDTTVLAHLRGYGAGEGVGRKPGDIAGVYACSDCHAAIDRVNRSEEFEANREYYLVRALIRTHQRMFEDALDALWWADNSERIYEEAS